MTCSKPFRLLQLPSLAHDIIFSQMDIGDIYDLSKCSTRSRCAVKIFTRRQSYYFGITADKYYYSLQISSATGLAFWGATKEEILYILDVFTREVNELSFDDTTKLIETTEFLKRATPSPVESVYCGNEETIIDDELYKYVLKEFRDAKELSIRASPSAGFRFDEMEPFTGEYICITSANWVTVDHLIRCFPNAEKVSLCLNAEKCLTPQLMSQFFNAWRNGSRMRELDIECNRIFIEFQAMFENVPKTVVKRVEVKSGKRMFDDRQCFLIRQEASGVEAIAYRNFPTLYFTTDFRLLTDDEPDRDFDDSDDSFIDARSWPSDSDSNEDSDDSDDGSNQDEEERYPDSDDDIDKDLIEAEPANSDSDEPSTGDEIFLRDANWVTVDHVIGCFSNIETVGLKFNTELSLITPASMNHLLKVWQKEWRITYLELVCDWSYDEFQSIFENIPTTEVKHIQINYMKRVFEEGQCFLVRQEESGVELISYMSYDRDDGGPVFHFKTNFRLLRDDQSDSDSDDSDAGSNQDEKEDPDTDDDRDNDLIEAEPGTSDSDEDL